MTEHHTSQPARVFVIGATLIAEDPALSALTTEQVRALLRFSYPEIASATVRVLQIAVEQHGLERRARERRIAGMRQRHDRPGVVRQLAPRLVYSNK